MDSEPTRFVDASEEHTVVLGADAAQREGEGDAGEEHPRRISRFVLLGVLGQGGMGRVFRAYDPSLAREVAIKLLHGESRDPAAAERLVREAQAMAQVSHPNIVTIYEVGREEGRVFLAMELVTGKTLRQWLKDGRSTEEIVDAFKQAAAGLHAAHERGLVHRDFKPGNVFVGEDGRVRVGDFGLAKAQGSESDSLSGADAISGDSELTQRGSVIGTPPYMAPEQHAGLELSPACDQYAFGVALYEALEGERPFGQRKLTELAQAKGRKEMRAMAKTPGRLAKVIERALEPEAGARFESMTEVMKGMAPRRKSGAAWTIGLGVALVGAVALASPAEEQGAQTQCDADALAELWNEARQAEAKAAFVESGKPYAEATFESANERMNAYVKAWSAGRNDACLTATGGEEEAQALADARRRCLDRGKAEFESLAGFFGEPTETTVKDAPALAAGLPKVGRCTDPGYVRTYFGDTTTPEEKLEPVRRELDRLRIKTRADSLEPEELREFEAASERALELDPVLGAQSLSILGVAQVRAGKKKRGLETLEAAYNAAIAAGLWVDAAESATNLSNSVLYPPRPGPERLAWANRAEAVLQHVDDRERLELRIELTRTEAYNINGLADPDKALFHAERAIGLATQRPEGDDERNRAMRAYGLALGSRPGKAPMALGYLAAALIADRAVYGDTHPTVATDLNYLTVIQFGAGMYQEASVTARETYEVHAAIRGPTSQLALDSLENVALLCMEVGDLACAEEAYADVMDVRAETPDPSALGWATTLTNVGDLYARQGDLEKGLPLVREGLELREREGLTPGHPSYSYSHMTLARHLLAAGEVEEALESLEVALRQPHRVGGRDLTDTYLILTRALCASGAPAQQAEAALEKAEAAAKPLRALPQPLAHGFRDARACVRLLPEGEGGTVFTRDG